MNDNHENTDVIVLNHFVAFTTPHNFEGKAYDGVDLSGLETITAKDMADAENWVLRKGVMSVLPEMTMEYACFIAGRASDKPIEFFERLSAKNATTIKNAVRSFFYGEG